MVSYLGATNRFMIRALWKSFFDVRKGEYLRTCFVALYLLFILFAYYILKPVSRALFLNQFDIDKLPYLMILIAFVGGFLAYLYTRLAVRSSLPTAVTWSTGLTIGCLVVISWLLGLGKGWVLYVFNIWVGLFSVVMVAQGWLIAANVFTSREAKRLYGLLGMSAVIGASFGGKFTAEMVRAIGPTKLVLASAVMVFIAYLCFRGLLMQPGVSLASAPAADSADAEFQFTDILAAIRHHRHLQVIVAIITVTFIVDVTIDYQFNAMAKLAYRDKDQLTAFLGNFYGVYLNLINFFLQFFLTAAVVRWFGVGGTLQIMPVTISVTALATFFLPGVNSSAALRLTEAATRYTLNRTGMELLYVPLPADLKNRTKAFVDIFVDRMGRGLGGVILIFCTSVLTLTPKQIPLITVGFSLVWIALAARASREYAATVRRRLSSRRLDMESSRVSVDDPATLALLEQTACGENPRQAAYALGLLAEAPGYNLRPLLGKLAENPAVEVRTKVFELARVERDPGNCWMARSAELFARIGATCAPRPSAAARVTCSWFQMTPSRCCGNCCRLRIRISGTAPWMLCLTGGNSRRKSSRVNGFPLRRKTPVLSAARWRPVLSGRPAIRVSKRFTGCWTTRIAKWWRPLAAPPANYGTAVMWTALCGA